MALYHTAGGQTYTLGSSIGSTDTSILLSSFKEPVSGVAYTMALLNTDIAYGTIAPKTSSSEFISFTGITQNADGTATLTGVTRGLAKKYPFTSSSTFKLPHAGQSQFILSDAPQVFEKYAAKANDETITGTWTFSTFPVTPATPVATTTTEGMMRVSTAPADALHPIAYGANEAAISYIPTAGQKQSLAGTQGVPATGNEYVTKDNVFTADTDQTQTTQNSTVEIGEANLTGKKNILVQSFTPTKTKIRGVKLYKAADTGTFTGTVTVALYADSGGSPTGSALATVTITNAVWLATAVGEFTATFSSEYASMVAGSLYWIHVTVGGGGDSSNHPNLGTNSAGGYTSGSVKYYNGTDGWVAIANIDLYFKTLQGILNQISQNPPLDIQTFTSSGTWTMPTNAKEIMVELWGGGGGGAGNSASASARGGGGGGGSYHREFILPDAISSPVTITIPAAAAGGIGRNSGAKGGDVTFGTYLTGYGGGGGGSDNSDSGSGGGGAGMGGAGVSATLGSPGAGGIPVAGTVGSGRDSYFGGGAGGSSTGSVGGLSFYGGGGGGAADAGGASIYGGGGGGGGQVGSVAAGGTSKFGGAGGAGANGNSPTNTGADGNPGTQPGGGGGGSATGAGATARNGGAGGKGQIRVTTFF